MPTGRTARAEVDMDGPLAGLAQECRGLEVHLIRNAFEMWLQAVYLFGRLGCQCA